ncbi:hypothetical protein Tco_1459081 [Tanacetum coccineum]
MSLLTPSDIQHSAATQIWGCYRLVSEPSHVLLHHTLSPKIRLYGSEHRQTSLPPPSSDYIPGLEDPQTPLVPQDEDECEPMFIQPHDPDYMPEPIYPEYIPLEDEHVFPVEEQSLPPIDSPTAESPGYDEGRGEEVAPSSGDSAVVIPNGEPFPNREDQSHVITPPSMTFLPLELWITVRLQASFIPFHKRHEV